jgi:hypothetical protein
VRKRSSTAVAVSEGEKAGGGSGEGLVVLVGVEEVGDVGLGGVLWFVKRGGRGSKKVRNGKEGRNDRGRGREGNERCCKDRGAPRFATCLDLASGTK